MAPLMITVTGESTILRAAERGVLTVRVSSAGKSQDDVSEDVTGTCNKLRVLLEGLAPKNVQGFAPADAPVSQFSMSSFQTSSHVPRGDDGKELDREYKASTYFTIIFQDFQKLGEITSTLFRTPHVEIERTDWRLTPATLRSLGTEARQKAMRDAMQRAQDYCDVLERHAVAVEVTDYGSGQSYRVASQELSRPRGSSASKTQVDGMTLEPEDVELKSSVDVKFQAD